MGGNKKGYWKSKLQKARGQDTEKSDHPNPVEAKRDDSGVGPTTLSSAISTTLRPVPVAVPVPAAVSSVTTNGYPSPKLAPLITIAPRQWDNSADYLDVQAIEQSCHTDSISLSSDATIPISLGCIGRSSTRSTSSRQSLRGLPLPRQDRSHGPVFSKSASSTLPRKPVLGIRGLTAASQSSLRSSAGVTLPGSTFQAVVVDNQIESRRSIGTSPFRVISSAAGSDSSVIQRLTSTPPLGEESHHLASTQVFAARDSAVRRSGNNGFYHNQYMNQSMGEGRAASTRLSSETGDYIPGTGSYSQRANVDVNHNLVSEQAGPRQYYARSRSVGPREQSVINRQTSTGPTKQNAGTSAQRTNTYTAEKKCEAVSKGTAAGGFTAAAAPAAQARPVSPEPASRTRSESRGRGTSRSRDIVALYTSQTLIAAETSSAGTPGERQSRSRVRGSAVRGQTAGESSQNRKQKEYSRSRSRNADHYSAMASRNITSHYGAGKDDQLSKGSRDSGTMAGHFEPVQAEREINGTKHRYIVPSTSSASQQNLSKSNTGLFQGNALAHGHPKDAFSRQRSGQPPPYATVVDRASRASSRTTSPGLIDRGGATTPLSIYSSYSVGLSDTASTADFRASLAFSSTETRQSDSDRNLNSSSRCSSRMSTSSSATGTLHRNSSRGTSSKYSRGANIYQEQNIRRSHSETERADANDSRKGDNVNSTETSVQFFAKQQQQHKPSVQEQQQLSCHGKQQKKQATARKLFNESKDVAKKMPETLLLGRKSPVRPDVKSQFVMGRRSPGRRRSDSPKSPRLPPDLPSLSPETVAHFSIPLETDTSQLALVESFISHSSSVRPANIKFLVVSSYRPQDHNNWAAKDELSVRAGTVVTALYKQDAWLAVSTESGAKGFVPYSYTRPVRQATTAELGRMAAETNRRYANQLTRMVQSSPSPSVASSVESTQKTGELLRNKQPVTKSTLLFGPVVPSGRIEQKTSKSGVSNKSTCTFLMRKPAGNGVKRKENGKRCQFWRKARLTGTSPPPLPQMTPEGFSGSARCQKSTGEVHDVRVPALPYNASTKLARHHENLVESSGYERDSRKTSPSSGSDSMFFSPPQPNNASSAAASVRNGRLPYDLNNVPGTFGGSDSGISDLNGTPEDNSEQSVDVTSAAERFAEPVYKNLMETLETTAAIRAGRSQFEASAAIAAALRRNRDSSVEVERRGPVIVPPHEATEEVRGRRSAEITQHRFHPPVHSTPYALNSQQTIIAPTRTHTAAAVSQDERNEMNDREVFPVMLTSSMRSSNLDLVPSTDTNRLSPLIKSAVVTLANRESSGVESYQRRLPRAASHTRNSVRISPATTAGDSKRSSPATTSTNGSRPKSILKNKKPEIPKNYKGPHVTVVYDYEPMNEDDTAVRSGETVRLLNDQDTQWVWVQKADGVEGFMPKEYIINIDVRRRRPVPAARLRSVV